MTAETARRLLIVDDEPQLLAMLQVYFTGAGYAVETAPDVREAAQKLAERFDAVLLDIKLRGGNGADLLPKARLRNPRAGIFLMTGAPSLDTLIAAKQHGAAAYFRKPLNLAQVDERLRAFLGEEPRPVIEGAVVVVGSGLRERLGDRLARVQAVACEEEEAAFQAALQQHRPRAILADAGAPTTRPFLQACRGRGRDAACFVLVSDEDSLDAANDLLFGEGATACVPADASQEQVEQSLRAALELFEVQQMDAESPAEEIPPRCEHAHPYRNGYYCLAPGACPYGAFQGGWIFLDGKEYQKCLKRPFVLQAPEQAGFVSIAGRPDPPKCMESRKRLMALVRRGKTELIIDALGLTHAPYNLFEALADVSAELARRHGESAMSVINLSEQLLDEFKRAMPNKGVRFYGPRMVDQPGAFARWGTRFD